MRASRLLSVLMLLQTRGKLTARQIADELEVSVRTVHRDLESLAESGVPVIADRGATGGYRLLDGYRTRLTGLTADEADSLFLAGLPSAADDLGLGALAATAELKLLAALPPPLRERAGRAREHFHLDAPLLADVAAAVWSQHRIHVTYHRWRAPQEVERVLEPLGVVLKSGTWYLVARAAPQPGSGPAPTDPRTYRVGKILALTTTGDRDRPPDFDLAAYWATWTARYESEVYRETATIRFSPTGVTMAPYRLPPAVTRAIRATATGPADTDGWVEARIPIESVRHATGELLSLGPDVEVLTPPALRTAATALAALYDPSHVFDVKKKKLAGESTPPLEAARERPAR